MKILVDSSVWIDFFNGNDNREAQILKNSIRNNDQTCISPTILQEVLQGFKDERDYQIALELLTAFSILQWDSIELAVEAAQLYRTLRKKGITINTSNDCLIATIARKFGCHLLSCDKHFCKIAQGLSLQLL